MNWLKFNAVLNIPNWHLLRSRFNQEAFSRLCGLENPAIMAHILQWGGAGDPVQFRTLCAVTGPLTEILVNKQQQWMPNKWWLRCWFSQVPSFNRIDRRYVTRETLFCTGSVIVKDYFKHIRRNLNGDNADMNMIVWSMVIGQPWQELCTLWTLSS